MISTTNETLKKTFGKKIFSVVYQTKSGRVIKRRGQFGVMKHCKNPPKENNSCMNYFDLEKQNYRNMNLHNILLIKQGKIVFKDRDFEEEELENKTFIISTETRIIKEYRVKAKDENHAREIKSRLHSQAHKSINELPEVIVYIEEEEDY